MNQPFDVHGNQGGHHPYATTDIRYGNTVTQVDPAGNPIPQPNPYPVSGQHYSPDQNFSLPAGTAAQAAKMPEPQPTMVDAIASDAKAADETPPVEPPEGAPKLRPLHTLPFRERGNAMRLFSELQKIEGPKEGESPTLDQVADMYDGLARIDDFLAAVAENADEYRAWVAGPGADEATFAQLWNSYSAQKQPGEAPSSSS
ncbi:MAG TPA: hypothetical protein VK735_44175 [Pseudonocardia sp.]|uniref:hypothetical protein n=1 Tax=Pseudonocardia sp. TaxID=60912 RepID=UPI002C752903|nr:hypothetical protein [Pseudonocardia sp.]HTF54483.1 hypothetical protein [Pseudonocardia sp.]